MKTLNIIRKLFFLLLFFIFSHAVAQSPAQQLEAANNLYGEAHYEEALKAYLNLIDLGYSSDALFYNTGNTYFKLKDIPSAILYYEKALKINPSDDDIKHNLQVANSMIIDKIDLMPELFFRQWWRAFYNLMPANSWAWVSTIVFLFTLVAAYLYITSQQTSVRRSAFFSGILLILMTIITFGLASQKYYYTRQTNEGIIFAPTITVKSSPSESSVDLFVLHEGTKVALLDETAGWQKIRIANGSIGWLREGTFKGI
ncbi:tetratricopeptide repeat protein [Bacteroidales bacterium]